MTIANVIAGELIDPAWGNDVADLVNALAYTNGTYTPTLTGMAVGTGGSAANSANYTFVGGDQIGDTGLLIVEGNIVFGTTGATLPAAAAITASLPAGFNFENVTPVLARGECTMAIAGSNYHGLPRYEGPSTFRFLGLATAGSYITHAATTATVPNTWAAGSAIRWAIAARAVRV